jgi:hypothetical protein
MISMIVHLTASLFAHTNLQENLRLAAKTLELKTLHEVAKATKSREIVPQAVPVSTGPQGRKRRSCIKTDLDSAKETKIKTSKPAQDKKAAANKLKKTRLDFSEAV